MPTTYSKQFNAKHTNFYQGSGKFNQLHLEEYTKPVHLNNLINASSSNSAHFAHSAQVETNKNQPKTISKNLLTCQICLSQGITKTYEIRDSLTRHLRSHDPSTYKICKICDKVFPRGDNLKQHMKTHQPKMKKSFICEYNCGAPGFSRKDCRKRHYYDKVKDHSACKKARDLINLYGRLPSPNELHVHVEQNKKTEDFNNIRPRNDSGFISSIESDVGLSNTHSDTSYSNVFINNVSPSYFNGKSYLKELSYPVPQFNFTSQKNHTKTMTDQEGSSSAQSTSTDPRLKNDTKIYIFHQTIPSKTKDDLLESNLEADNNKEDLKIDDLMFTQTQEKIDVNILNGVDIDDDVFSQFMLEDDIKFAGILDVDGCLEDADCRCQGM